MRIGFFTSVDGWGGSEMYLRSLMTGIRKRGHDVVLFGVEGTRLFREATEAGVRCVAWRRSRWISPIPNREVSETENTVLPARRLRKCLLRVSPSIVADILRDCSKVAALACLFSKERVDVMHVNINEYEVAGIACQLCGIHSLGMFCTFPVRSKEWPKRSLVRWPPRLHTAVASKTRACINAWQDYCNLPADTCRFIWNGVDLKRFRYKERDSVTEGRPFRLLTVGRLHSMKGLEVLVRAISVLRDKNILLSIAGHGEKEYKEALERLIGHLNLSSKVRLLGYVEDVATLYRQTDCTVSASVALESFGQSLIEAMACGSPLITSDFGPFPEINAHKVTGLLVPAGSVSSLAEAISRMMEDENSRIQMGRRARERVERFFGLDRMVEETVDLYSEVAEGNTCGVRKKSP